MKSVTVSVPDEVYRQACVRAAEASTSVSAMVTEYLRGLSTEEDTKFDRLRDLQRRASTGNPGFSATDRLARDEVHDRAALH